MIVVDSIELDLLLSAKLASSKQDTGTWISTFKFGNNTKSIGHFHCVGDNASE
jgi:hypothetical protein